MLEYTSVSIWASITIYHGLKIKKAEQVVMSTLAEEEFDTADDGW